MSRVEPVDPRVRLAITQWPPDAPRGAVSAFCVEQGISRETFYAIRRRAAMDGPAAALEPRSRRPRQSPAKLADDLARQSVAVRAALEPKKKPRASYRRFVYPAPDACWQLDGTEYVLTGGRKCVIFQLIDDHSRLAVASHVAWGETSEGALTVVRKGIDAHGVPQRLLSDNGAALNPSRRGVLGQLVAYLRSLGVEPITGKPYKPTTQGKNERFHQTLFRYLDKQPLADSLEQLQAQVDAFDVIYNTERPHQGLPGRITPARAWDATPKTEAPRPVTPQAPLTERAEEIRVKKVTDSGAVEFRGIRFGIGRAWGDQRVCVMDAGKSVMIFDLRGTLIIEHPWPKPGVTYVSNGRPRGRGSNTV